MLTTSEIQDKGFAYLKDYEQFVLEWTRECARLNPTEENVLRLEIAERRARLMKLEERR